MPISTASITLSHVKYWLWRALTVVCIGPLYVTLIADGGRRLIPALGMRLSRIPFAGFLDRFVMFNGLSLSHLSAFILFIAVIVLWEQVILILLGSQIDSHGFDSEKYVKFVMTMGISLITCDAVIFFLAISRSGWGGGRFSFTAVVGTLCYLGLLIFTGFYACVLKQRIHQP